MATMVAISPADTGHGRAGHRQPKPGLRVLAAPRSEPPTDDERASAGLDAPPMAALLLPLDLARSHAPYDRGHRSGNDAIPAPSTQTTRSRAKHAQTGRAGASDAAIVSRDAPAVALADLHRIVSVDLEPSAARLATRRFLATCVEVIGGFRPVAQLRPLCFPEQFAEITHRLTTHPATGPGWRSRSPGELPPASPSQLGGRGASQPLRGANRGSAAARSAAGPPRTGRVNQTGPGDRVMVRRVQICEAIDGVAEIAVVLARRDRVWAMALRMERSRGAWLCTHLEVV